MNTTKTIRHRGYMTLLALLITMCMYAQNAVKGVVLDETDEPLIGATIVVKGTSAAGAVTDLDGNFTIQARKEMY